MSGEPLTTSMTEKLRKLNEWLKKIVNEHSSLGPLVAAILGGALLVIAFWIKSGFAAGVGTMAILLLTAGRPNRDLLITTALLGATLWGFSEILRHVLEPGSIAPSKTAIIIAVILAWTILVAVCLGRMRGNRDDD